MFCSFCRPVSTFTHSERWCILFFAFPVSLLCLSLSAIGLQHGPLELLMKSSLPNEVVSQVEIGLSVCHESWNSKAKPSPFSGVFAFCSFAFQFGFSLLTNLMHYISHFITSDGIMHEIIKPLNRKRCSSVIVDIVSIYSESFVGLMPQHMLNT